MAPLSSLRELPKTSLAAWFGLIATVIGLVLFAQDPLVDAYDLRWPLAVLAGVLFALLLWKLIEGHGSVQVVSGRTKIQSELAEIVSNARELLICVGSRSRDHDYLRDIEERVRSQESLRHLRVFCGDPRHTILKQHAKKLMSLRASDPVGAGRIKMAICPAEKEPEPSLCVSESRALVVVPALGKFGRYDSGILLRRPADVKTVRAYAEAMFTSGRELTDMDEIDALPVLDD